MPKQNRPESEPHPMQHAGAGGGGGNPHPHVPPSAPQPRVPPNTPQTTVGSAVGGPGARLDVPTMRPPGFSAAPGRYVDQPGGASWQAPGFPPPPAGSTAESAFQLQAPLPIGEKATHFSGPIVSGGIPAVSGWTTPHGGPMLTDPIGGSANLTAGFWVDYSQGDFTIPIQFPPDSLIGAIGAATAVAFASAPTFQIGRTSGGSEIGGGSMPAPGGPLTFIDATGQLPLWGAQDATPPLVPFQAFLTVAGNTGGAAGLGVILVQFIRIAQRWT